MEKCLTPEQQKLVEENHNLIYSYANQKGLNIDEFYPLLAEGLCKAALSFDPSKGKFSTIAYKTMERKMTHYYRDTNAEKRKGDYELLYYHQEVYSEDGDEKEYDWLSSLSSDENIEEKSIFSVWIQKVSAILKYRERKILSLLSEGYGKEEILRKLGIGSSSYNNDLKKIREHFKDFKK